MIRVHIRMSSTYILRYNYNNTAVLLHAVGTQDVEIQYASVRVHVRVCTYKVYIMSYEVHALQQQTATEAVVLQLLAISTASRIAVYTPV